MIFIRTYLQKYMRSHFKHFQKHKQSVYSYSMKNSTPNWYIICICLSLYKSDLNYSNCNLKKRKWFKIKNNTDKIHADGRHQGRWHRSDGVSRPSEPGSPGPRGGIYADGRTMPTAAVGIDGGLPTAVLCQRFFPGRRHIPIYADGPDKKPSA